MLDVMLYLEKEDTKNDLSVEIRSQLTIALNLPIAHNVMQVCAVPVSRMMQDRCMSKTHKMEACSEVHDTMLHENLSILMLLGNINSSGIPD